MVFVWPHCKQRGPQQHPTILRLHHCDAYEDGIKETTQYIPSWQSKAASWWGAIHECRRGMIETHAIFVSFPHLIHGHACHLVIQGHVGSCLHALEHGLTQTKTFCLPDSIIWATLCLKLRSILCRCLVLCNKRAQLLLYFFSTFTETLSLQTKKVGTRASTHTALA